MVLEKGQNYAVVNMVNDLGNVITSANLTKPDVVLFDVNLNRKNSRETYEKITAQFPNINSSLFLYIMSVISSKTWKKAVAKGYFKKW